MSLSVYTPGNGSGTNTGVGGAYTGILLVDANGIKWFTTVLPAGNLDTNIVTSIPSGAFYPNQCVTQDQTGTYWTIGVTTTGNLSTTKAGNASQSVLDLVVNDSTYRSWVITVNTTGNLVTA